MVHITARKNHIARTSTDPGNMMSHVYFETLQVGAPKSAVCCFYKELKML